MLNIWVIICRLYLRVNREKNRRQVVSPSSEHTCWLSTCRSAERRKAQFDVLPNLLGGVGVGRRSSHIHPPPTTHLSGCRSSAVPMKLWRDLCFQSRDSAARTPSVIRPVLSRLWGLLAPEVRVMTDRPRPSAGSRSGAPRSGCHSGGAAGRWGH